VKLIITPEAGVEPLLAAIKSAKKSVEIAIFRFDRRDVEMALKAAAAAKQVGVTAVIAFANREGITHVIFGQTARSRWEILLHGSVLNRFLQEIKDASVQVVPLTETRA